MLPSEDILNDPTKAPYWQHRICHASKEVWTRPLQSDRQFYILPDDDELLYWEELVTETELNIATYYKEIYEGRRSKNNITILQIDDTYVAEDVSNFINLLVLLLPSELREDLSETYDAIYMWLELEWEELNLEDKDLSNIDEFELSNLHKEILKTVAKLNLKIHPNPTEPQTITINKEQIHSMQLLLQEYLPLLKKQNIINAQETDIDISNNIHQIIIAIFKYQKESNLTPQEAFFALELLTLDCIPFFFDDFENSAELFYLHRILQDEFNKIKAENDF